MIIDTYIHWQFRFFLFFQTFNMSSQKCNAIRGTEGDSASRFEQGNPGQNDKSKDESTLQVSYL